MSANDWLAHVFVSVCVNELGGVLLLRVAAMTWKEGNIPAMPKIALLIWESVVAVSPLKNPAMKFRM